MLLHYLSHKLQLWCHFPFNSNYAVMNVLPLAGFVPFSQSCYKPSLCFIHSAKQNEVSKWSHYSPLNLKYEVSPFGLSLHIRLCFPVLVAELTSSSSSFFWSSIFQLHLATLMIFTLWQRLSTQNVQTKYNGVKTTWNYGYKLCQQLRDCTKKTKDFL